jgi:hypothetical protein
MGPVGGTLVQPVVVQVRSSQGALAGVTVSFQVESGSGSVSRASVQTDATGNVSVSWSLGGVIGEQRLRVSAATLPTLTVRATAQPGAPAVVLPVAGNSQFAVVKRSVAVRPRIRVTDGFGNALPGLPVIYSVSHGGGTITDSVHTTDAVGEATLGSWTLGPAAGLNRLKVSSGPLEGELIAFGTPAVILPVTGDAQSANTGTLTPVRPAVQALDGDGAPLAGVPVQFIVQSGGGTLLDPVQQTDAAGIATVGGWIIGPTPGPNILAAQVSGVLPTQFTATGVPGIAGNLTLASGDGLTSFFGNFLSGAPTVRVTDQAGNPVAGTTVVFEVLSGSGTVAAATPVSDFDGRAALGAWRLGTSEGLQSVRATVTGLAPVTFTANAVLPPPPAYNIEVRFITTPTASQQAAFTNAVARWQLIVLGDLTDIPINVPSGGCLPVSLNETIDDVVIFAELVDIDGVGKVLGSAGPCYIRTANTLTVVGRMRLDNADLTSLEASGQLETVILHEMGHVLGIGSLWTLLDLLQGPGGGDPFFSGSGGRAAFAVSAAPMVFPGNAVPVENVGGPGTRDAHWRESTLDTELMTGLIDPGGNPLSAVTSASLRDLGYVVDDAVSEPYTLPAFLRTLGTQEMRLVEVPLPWPIYTVSRSGRIDRVILR